MFRNTNELPPGGWRYFQPEIEWPTNPKEFRGIGLDATVDRILQKRAANPRFGLSLDRAQVTHDVLVFTEAVVRKMKGTESYFINDMPTPMPTASFPLARNLVHRVAAVAGTIKKQVAGVGLLIDWLGDGMEPVPIELATARARVCATSGPGGEACPFNRPATGLQKLSSAAAEDIRQLMETRKDLKLETPHDAALHTCQICECPMPLKVWTPLKHIVEKTPAATMAQFRSQWPMCWIVTEQGE